MKYWRGYLTAAIFAAITWVLLQFGQRYSLLVDAVYPYVMRTLQTILAGWSSGVSFCIWQVALIFLLVAALATIVLMIILKWNPIQWLGWVLAVISAGVMLHTAVYGLNQYAGPLADGVRMEADDYTMSEMVEAIEYYQARANDLAMTAPRDENGNLKPSTFDELNQQAGDGFDVLVYEKSFPVFAGSKVPVKQLSWPGLFTSMGVTGVTVSLTGEAAVNPQIPAIYRPFAICRGMARRMCISVDADADLAAFLACRYNASWEYQYSAYFMAYYQSLKVLSAMSSSSAKLQAQQIKENANQYLQRDLESYESFFKDNVDESRSSLLAKLREIYRNAGGRTEQRNSGDLIIRWYIQEIILPTKVEEKVPFDPFDEDQVNLHPTQSED